MPMNPGGGGNHEQASILGMAYIKTEHFKLNSLKVKKIVLYPKAGRLR